MERKSGKPTIGNRSTEQRTTDRPNGMRDTVRSTHPEVEPALANTKVTYAVDSSATMENMRGLLEEKGYTCTRPEPIFPGGSRRPVTLVGKILLGGEERAEVRVRLDYLSDYVQDGPFKITTSDQAIKRALEDVYGRPRDGNVEPTEAKKAIADQLPKVDSNSTVVGIKLQEQVKKVKRELEENGYTCSELFGDIVDNRVCGTVGVGNIVHNESGEERASAKAWFLMTGHGVGDFSLTHFEVTTSDPELLKILKPHSVE